MTRPTFGYVVASGGSSGSDITKADRFTTQAKSANFTAAPWFFYLINSTSGTVAGLLPSASVAGEQVAFKWETGTNTVTLNRAGSDTIGAAATSASFSLASEVWVFESSGTGQWNLISGNKTLASLDARYPLMTDTRLNVAMLPADHGLISWSVPIDYATTNSLISAAGAAGVLVLTRIRRTPAATITNLHVDVAGAGSGLTNSFAALFTSAGALLGQSADQSTAWQSAGFKTMPLAGGALGFAGGDLYVGIWYNGTTAPALLRSGSGAGGAATPGQVSGNFNASSANAGLTTTAPSNLGAQSSINLRFWAAVS